MKEGWVYYNHTLRPDVLIHEEVDISAINDPIFWKTGGYCITRTLDY